MRAAGCFSPRKGDAMKCSNDALRLLAVIMMLAAGCASPGGSTQQEAQDQSPTAVIAPASATQASPPSPIPPTLSPSLVPSSTRLASAGSVTDDYGYGADDYGQSVSDSTPTTVQAGSQAGQATLLVSASSLGSILIDARGLTLYAFTQDSPGTSTCQAGCVEFWPPLLISGSPSAGDGIQASLLGTITRSDGGSQVTYAGRPLYTFAQDNAPGELNGQGSGGVWFVVTPEGDIVS